MSYKPRVYYTPEELDTASISDLLVDLHCARRDGHREYAGRLETELAEKKANFVAAYGYEFTPLSFAEGLPRA